MNKLLVRWTLETMLDVHRTGSFYLLSVLYRQCLLQGMRVVRRHDDRAVAIVNRFHADEAAPFALIQIADGPPVRTPATVRRRQPADTYAVPLRKTMARRHRYIR